MQLIAHSKKMAEQTKNFRGTAKMIMQQNGRDGFSPSKPSPGASKPAAESALRPVRQLSRLRGELAYLQQQRM